jgi:hypothetical protein
MDSWSEGPSSVRREMSSGGRVNYMSFNTSDYKSDHVTKDQMHLVKTKRK